LLRDTESAKLKAQGLFRQQKKGTELAQELESHGSCLACDIGNGTVKRFTELLLQDMHDEELQKLLLQSGGLCLPHLRTALSNNKRARTQDVLISLHREAWQKIMGELEEFIRKNDYRFQDEKMTPEEGTSWSRVLDLVVGLE
jgi:hypothetical protein